jgi:hypothetical protein
MAVEFNEPPRLPESNATPDGGPKPSVEVVELDALEAPDAIPPEGLIRRRPHIFFWLALAPLSGALIALILVGLTTG